MTAGSSASASSPGPRARPVPEQLVDVDHDVLEVGQRRLELGVEGDEVGPAGLGHGDHDAGAGVGEHVLELAAPVADVEGDEHGAEAGRREQQADPRRAVRQRDRDPVAGADAARGEPGREPVGVLVELAQGDRPRCLAQEHRVRAVPGGGAQEAGEAHGSACRCARAGPQRSVCDPRGA